ncbi:phospholipase A2 inhibitor gamma subunit B-like [Pseudophryne corroboree]|uniref:phospholipase A2 inhibitor gamma subunit B-like n=1 Tax=Pseudophryne corroboree TaxID=495146 RepID=UPI003081C071
MTCPADCDVCLSTLVQYEMDTSNPESQSLLQSIGPRPPLVFVRGCGQSAECKDVLILRTPYNRMVTSSTCCKTDLCSSALPTVIPEASNNGLACNGCFQTTSCLDFTPVYCRGSESRCFSYSNLQLNDNVSVSMAGCATETACDIDLQQGNLTVCRDGVHSGSRVVPSSLLLIAAGLSVTYILYLTPGAS